MKSLAEGKVQDNAEVDVRIDAKIDELFPPSADPSNIIRDLIVDNGLSCDPHPAPSSSITAVNPDERGTA